MNNIKALILAGGIGKRFWPLSTHKSLISFLGKTRLGDTLEKLKAVDITDVIIVTPANIKDFAHIEQPGMDITIVEQSSAGGMADAVIHTKDAIGSSPLLILTASDVINTSLFEQLKKDSRETILIGAKKLDTYFNGGYLKFEGNRLVGIIEKPGVESRPSRLVNLVFHYFPDSSQFIQTLEQTKSSTDDAYERALTKVLEKSDAHVLTHDGYWQPMKYPWHVLDVMDYFLNKKCTAHRGKNVEIKSNVVIEGPVHIEDNVRIFENTKIVGPCYIGGGAIIGNNNIIRHSHIGSGCITGFNTDITRSYVGDGCWFHSNYIGDSVLESNVNIGAGSVLANLRLDEGDIWSVIRGERVNTKRNKLGAVIGHDVGIGVNTSIMPGIKIGKHSCIGAGMVIDKDIPDESFVIGKTTLKIQQNTQRISTLRSEFKKKI